LQWRWVVLTEAREDLEALDVDPQMRGMGLFVRVDEGEIEFIIPTATPGVVMCGSDMAGANSV